MKLFEDSKNSDYADERIKMQRLTMINQAYAIVMLILMVSILIKQFVYNLHFSAYMTEFIAFFVASFYILIKSCFLGHRIYSGKKRLALILTPIITATVITVLSFLGNLEHHQRIQEFWVSASALVITFLSSLTITFLIMLVIDKASRKRNKKLEEKFEEE
ncbi:MAG: DUF6773 family protein [Eubacteriales bacterium]